MPFNNNKVERNLRMMNIEQKISHRSRTAGGARMLRTLRRYVVIARKQDRSGLDTLRNFFNGHSFLPALPDYLR